MAQDAADEMRIEPCGGIGLIYFDDDRMACESGAGLFKSMLKDASNILRSGAYGDGAGIDLSHFNSFPDELIEARRFFVDEQDEIAARGFVKALILNQGSSGSADAGERSAEFVSERIDERSAKALAFAGSLNAGVDLNGRSACKRN